jgi:hypothetical protein
MTNAAIQFANAVWDALSTGIQDAESIDKGALRDAGNRFYFSEDRSDYPSLIEVYFATLEYVNDGHLAGLTQAAQEYEKHRSV